MYLIRVESEEELTPLTESLDAIDDLDALDLGEIDTLQLMRITNDTAEYWVEGRPVTANESAGFVISPFAVEGVHWLRDYGSELHHYGVDVTALKAFADRCQSGQVFFLDTF